MYTILLALGNPTVHYFSLDIDGPELQVLRTIPLDKVDIKIFDIEDRFIPMDSCLSQRNLSKPSARKLTDTRET